MKRVVVPLLLGFGVALAAIVGWRMSTDAMAVVIGVAVGVAASIPTSLLLVALLRRERGAYRNEPPPEAYRRELPAAPNIIVIDPAQLGRTGGQAYPQVPMPPPEYLQEAGMRRLRVVGADNDWGAGD